MCCRYEVGNVMWVECWKYDKGKVLKRLEHHKSSIVLKSQHINVVRGCEGVGNLIYGICISIENFNGKFIISFIGE